MLVDPSVAVAQADLALSFDNITTLCTSAGTLIPSSALGGMSLAPGLYYATTYLTLGGELTFDAAGDLNSVFAISSPQYLAVDPGAMMVSLGLDGEDISPQCYWYPDESQHVPADTCWRGESRKWCAWC